MKNPLSKLFLACIMIFVTTVALSNSESDSLVSIADSYYQQKNWLKAADAYQKITDSHPQNHLAWYRLASALIELNDPSPALQALNHAGNGQSIPRAIIFYQQARAYKLLKNLQAMYESLKQAAESGYSQTVNFRENIFWDDVKDHEQFNSIIKLVDKNAQPCLYDEKYAQFDFWLGHWDVYGNQQKTGLKYGRNAIEKSQNGCLLTEHWTATGGSTGTSMNYYDGTIGRWVQHWVSASGTTINYSGEVKNDSMILVGKIFYINTEQNPVRDFRGTWTPLDGGTVRQYFEESIDGGSSWYPWFEGYYFPVNSR